MLCDPQIVRAFRNPWHYSLDLWKYWTAIKVPILVIRGVESDLLPADLARSDGAPQSVRQGSTRSRVAVTRRRLMSADQIKLVSDFLASQASFA